jgi:hypothetical protein
MTNTAIKIVRPWPAEQPRPPLTHRTDGVKASTPEAANKQRQGSSRPLLKLRLA